VRLTLTIVDPATDQRADVVLDADGEAQVSAVADALVTLLGHPERTAARHATLYVDGEPLDPRATLHDSALREGTLVSLGDHAGCAGAELALPSAADAAVEPSADGTSLDYNRPPRLLPPLRQTRFRLPGRPVDQERRPMPIVMAVVPLVMSVVTASVFHRWYMLVFGFMSPLVLLGSHFSDRKAGRKSHRRKLADYRKTKAAIEKDAKSALLAERTARRAAFPDPAAVLLTAVGPRRRLWERRRRDADVLTIRVGMGDVNSEVVLDDPDQLDHKREQTWRALDVPVTVPLREHGVLGFAGQGDSPRAMVRWAVAQSAALHSPADLWIYVLTDVWRRESWEWVRWLPHARPAAGQDTLALLGVDADSTSRRVSELVQMVAARRSDMSRGAVVDAPDIMVVLDGARRLRSLPGMVQVLRVGPSVGVYSVCVDADEGLLPEECQAVVVQEAVGIRVQQTRTAVVRDVRPDTVSAPWCERFARALAPVRDISGDAGDAALPSTSRLLDALGLEPPTRDAIAAGWARGGRSTEALLGESTDGPFRIDLRGDGPHGLIAGTTGAGKSELLQSLVASLAVANRPDALTFVLIDYKGGAAFAQCERLPHTVGMVTDLDTHLVERALASLGAELRRREQRLASVGAKDIDDYADLLTRDSTLPALPRLVIVVDEFASMVRELPDFVTGMVNIAQRGRSLGIHLILATQRPGGVVSPEIRANTNLRIALRVTDANESADIIDAPDAGRIPKSTPGRAYARLGHSSLVAFQTSRIGGRRPGTASRDTLRPWVTEVDGTTLGRPAPVRPRQPIVADAEITDLQVLVEQIRAAADGLGVPAQHSPWLAALPEKLLLAEIEPEAPTAGDRGALPVAAFALEDVPDEQARRAAVIDLAHFDHLYVVGAPRSGRSQALRTIAGSLARTCSSADLHLYGIDCGNGALLPLADLPHCGAVVQRTQIERASRLVLRMAAEVRRRQGLLADGGFADLSEQRAAVAVHNRLPHVVVLLDRWEGFTTTLGEIDGGRLTEEVYVMLREGASVGVHLVLAGDRSLIGGRMGTFTDAKLVLRLSDKTDFSLAGINPRSVPDDLPPGRGFRSESGIETHVALLDADATAAGQAAALAAIATDAQGRDAAVPRPRRPFRVDVLPARLPFDQAWDLRVDTADRPLWALVGVGGDELAAQGPELRSGARSFVVAGPPRSGRSTVLLTMAQSLLAAGTSVVLATPRPSPLRDLDGTVGVRAVFTGCDIAALELAAALESGGGPCVVLVDDAELLRECDAADVLRSVMRSGDERPVGLVIAGGADDICTGFSGWQVEVKKSRQGTLLSPQGTTDGELIGVRLPRSVVGGPVVPGRALLHLGDTLLHTVQVPFPVAPGAAAG
jgi:S-DNA-T family DNA segregation ATPase FtsK/SpoIIIE